MERKLLWCFKILLYFLEVFIRSLQALKRSELTQRPRPNLSLSLLPLWGQLKRKMTNSLMEMKMLGLSYLL